MGSWGDVGSWGDAETDMLVIHAVLGSGLERLLPVTFNQVKQQQVDILSANASSPCRYLAENKVLTAVPAVTGDPLATC